MKLPILTLLLLCVTGLLAQSIPFPGPGQAATGASPSQTYFGGVANNAGAPLGTSEDDLTGYTVENDTVTAGGAITSGTCPGTGAKSLVALGLYARTTGAAGTIRLAIYGPVDGTHNTSLVAQGSAPLSVSGTTLAWYNHVAFVDATGTSIPAPTLQGGSLYRMVATATGGAVRFGYGTLGSSGKYGSTTYTAGYPATLAVLSQNNGAEFLDIRVGIQ